MPKLHPLIRHVTSTDPVFLRPEDVVEPIPDESEYVGARSKKRKRIETIANKYIKLGRRPLIVSAGLRGPFNGGWKNPWARPTSPAPSVEASRGQDVDQDRVVPLDDNDDDQVHVSPDTSSVQQDGSGPAEVSIIDPDPSISFDNHEDNSLWLRRPLPESTALVNSAHGHRDPSPTRARLGYRPVDQQGRLQLVTPRQPMNMAHSDPGRSVDRESDWISKAPASTITKESPVRSTESIASAKRKRTYSKHERANTLGDQRPSKTVVTPSPLKITPSTTQKGQYSTDAKRYGLLNPDTGKEDHASRLTPVSAVSQSAKTTQGPISKGSKSKVQTAKSNNGQQTSVSAPNTTSRTSRHDNEASVDPSARASSSIRSANTGQKRRKIPRGDTAPSERHDRVTSPTLASSTGFKYRKVGEAKQTKPLAKSKPRPVTFSSPAITKPPSGSANGPELDTNDGVNEAETAAAGKQAIERPDVYDVPESPAKQQQSYKSSRASGFSTQAALLMAQMEFQDSTMAATAATAEGDATPWLNVGSTPQDSIIPSPAFTPFHEFNAALEEDYAPEATMQDVPINTQDLFATISPFAQSTVKKSTRPASSNLRFSVFAKTEQDTPSHGGMGVVKGAKSPTPWGRIPLQAKNSRVSFSGAQGEKGSQDEKGSQEGKSSQETITGRTRVSRSKGSGVQALELPQLDFGASLDGLRSKGEVDFTDRFLLRLEDMT